METSVSLIADGVEMVDYPESTKVTVQLAATAWQSFLQLPQTVKNKFNAEQLQFSLGYEHKVNGQRESNDTKENFDITRESLVRLSQINPSNETVEFFLQSANGLFESLESMTVKYGQHIEATYGVTGFAAEAEASSKSVFIRFLKYPPMPEGTVIGESHVDHSGFTFHLYESTGGCDRLTFDKKAWLPMPVAPDKAAVFASMQTQLFSNNKLRGLCHQIIANQTTSKVGRTAIVAFVPLVNTPTYDRKIHGRLQEFTPGFNYTMETSKFSKLFT